MRNHFSFKEIIKFLGYIPPDTVLPSLFWVCDLKYKKEIHQDIFLRTESFLKFVYLINFFLLRPHIFNFSATFINITVVILPSNVTMWIITDVN